MTVVKQYFTCRVADALLLALRLSKIILIIAATCFIIGLWGVCSAHGHYIYSGWMQPDAPHMSCCHEHDCKPTEERVVGDHFEAFYGGKWLPVPAWKVMHQHSPDGRPHICVHDDLILCYQPGSGA